MIYKLWKEASDPDVPPDVQEAMIKVATYYLVMDQLRKFKDDEMRQDGWYYYHNCEYQGPYASSKEAVEAGLKVVNPKMQEART